MFALKGISVCLAYLHTLWMAPLSSASVTLLKATFSEKQVQVQWQKAAVRWCGGGGDAGECVCRIREPVSALDHTGKYSHGTSCCHAKMSRVNIVHIVPGGGVVTSGHYTLDCMQIIQILCNLCTSCQQSRYAVPLSDMEAMFYVYQSIIYDVYRLFIFIFGSQYYF